MKRGNVEAYRRLNYGGIELIPADEHEWHMPGGDTKTTKELVALGTERGVTVQLIEVDDDGQRIESLN